LGGAVSASLITFTMMFAACSKKSDLSVPKTTDPTSQKILNFKAKIETGNKSYETMSTDSAVWYVEAALNYTYCAVNGEVPETDALISDSCDFEINPQNGKVQTANAIDAYHFFETKMIAAYNSLNYTVKYYSVADVALKNNTLRLYYSVNYKASSEKSLALITDDWKWGWGLGKCDGTCVGQDATTVLYGVVNPHVLPPAGNYYFTDVNKNAMVSESFPTNTNPYGNYLMCYRHFTQMPLPDYICIPAAEMTYYTDGVFKAFGIAKIFLIPNGYSFKSWTITAARERYGTPSTAETFRHAIEITWGIQHNIPHTN
jgi:hypothetical protein